MARQERETLSGHLAPERIEPEKVQQLVRQALAQVANEQDADAALRIALLNAGLQQIPETPAALAMFVLSQLRSAVSEFVDERAADSMVRSLKPLLKLKSELELPSTADEPSESEVPPPSEELVHTVIVVDADVASRAKVARLLREARFNAVSAAEASVALAMCVRRRPDVVVAAEDASAGGQLSALLHVAFGSKAPPLVLLSKPVEAETLLAGIESALERKSP